MKKILLLTAVCLCVEQAVYSHIYQSKLSLLTGTGTKSWKLVSSLPANSDGCQISNPIVADNRYTFYADGRFEFDHGQLTKDPSCTVNCCSDFDSGAGQWRFIDGEQGITVSFDTKNSSGRTVTINLFIASIESISASGFVISDDGQSYEFVSW